MFLVGPLCFQCNQCYREAQLFQPEHRPEQKGVRFFLNQVYLYLCGRLNQPTRVVVCGLHQPHILCITSYPPHPPRHRLNQPIVPGDQWPASKFAVMLIDLCLPAEPAAGKSTGRNSRLITSIRSTCVCVNNRMHQPLCVQHCPSIASVTNITSFSSNQYTG